MIHNKHKKHIPVIEKTFGEMKDDGTIDKLYNNLIESLKQK